MAAPAIRACRRSSARGGGRGGMETLHRRPSPRRRESPEGGFAQAPVKSTPAQAPEFQAPRLLSRATPLLILLHPASTPTRPHRPSRNRDVGTIRAGARMRIYAILRECTFVQWVTVTNRAMQISDGRMRAPHVFRI